MYGQTGQKPHPIAANRPGATFEPFIKVIKKAIASSINIPYPVLFKDVEGVNFAGFRSAMLDAWRVFMARRTWMGQGFCQVPYTMLQEEAWLRGHLPAGLNFYDRMYQLTRCEWRGSPKGDIEPVKAEKADAEAVKNRFKSRRQVIAERGGGDFRNVFEDLEEEEEILKEKGLVVAPDPAQDERDKTADAVADRVVGAIEENREQA